MDSKTLGGKLAEMIANGFFNSATTGHKAFQELQRVGFRTAKPNVYRELKKIATMGFVTEEKDGYQAVKSMKVNIIQLAER